MHPHFTFCRGGYRHFSNAQFLQPGARTVRAFDHVILCPLGHSQRLRYQGGNNFLPNRKHQWHTPHHTIGIRYEVQCTQPAACM